MLQPPAPPPIGFSGVPGQVAFSNLSHPLGGVVMHDGGALCNGVLLPPYDGNSTQSPNGDPHANEQGIEHHDPGEPHYPQPPVPPRAASTDYSEAQEYVIDDANGGGYGDDMCVYVHGRRASDGGGGGASSGGFKRAKWKARQVL